VAAAAGRAEGRVESSLGLPSRVTDASLSLLQLRGVISRRLMFRLINATRAQTATAATAECSPCPAECGRFHLNEHESYTSEAAGRRVSLGEVVAVGGAIGLRLGTCECGALICHACKTLVDPADATTHMCKQGGAAVDPASKALLAKVCKACPGCGMPQQKTDGCALMMCGTVAHGRVADALRNGGCAYIFHWDTLEPQSAPSACTTATTSRLVVVPLALPTAHANRLPTSLLARPSHSPRCEMQSMIMATLASMGRCISVWASSQNARC